jgi:glutamyl-tRNA synthetase
MVITRFAPSPTGYLHIGGLRTALYSYLWAKKNSGKFLLRIEDTDLKRNSTEAAKAIEEAFKWVGLKQDGDIYYQSKRMDIYKEHIQKLLDEGKAYYCYMRKEELDALRQEQMKAKQRPRYDGRYRDFKGTPPEGVEPVVRIKTPVNETITFSDGIKGEISVNTADVMDDFIIARSDGTPTYNFVVAIDDHYMGVTDVIRGDDHLSNTPKQIIIYRAFGWDIPKFYHVPMILNPQGKKLSKRDGAMDVMEYKKEGYLPEALLNFLVRLGWSHGDQEIFTMDEMLRLFDPKDINKSASAYNAEKLLWLNARFIKEMSYDRFVKELENFGLNLKDIDKKEVLIDALRERVKTLKEFSQKAGLILKRPLDYEEKAVKKFLKADAKEVAKEFVNYLIGYEGELSLPTDYEKLVSGFLDRYNLKLKDIAQIIRIAVVGSAVSPSIHDIMCIIGKDELEIRLNNLILFMEKRDEQN